MLQLEHRLAWTDQERTGISFGKPTLVLSCGRRCCFDFNAENFSFPQVVEGSRAGWVSALRNHLGPLVQDSGWGEFALVRLLSNGRTLVVTEHVFQSLWVVSL